MHKYGVPEERVIEHEVDPLHPHLRIYIIIPDNKCPSDFLPSSPEVTASSSQTPAQDSSAAASVESIGGMQTLFENDDNF